MRTSLLTPLPERWGRFPRRREKAKGRAHRARTPPGTASLGPKAVAGLWPDGHTSHSLPGDASHPPPPGHPSSWSRGPPSRAQSPLSFLEPQPPRAPPCIPGPRWPAPPLLGTWLVWPGLGQARYKAASAWLAAPTSLLRPYPSHQPATTSPATQRTAGAMTGECPRCPPRSSAGGWKGSALSSLSGLKTGEVKALGSWMSSDQPPGRGERLFLSQPPR